MSRISHHSPVRFTDAQAIDLVRAATPDNNVAEAYKRISMLFDRTRIRIDAALSWNKGKPVPKKIEDMTSDERDALRTELKERITDVALLLNRLLDLGSDEWKNAPLIWEMLSFDADVLHSPRTPLPDVLREVAASLEGMIQGGIDVETLVQNIDDVIHQTVGRREAIERVMSAALDTDIAGTSLLNASDIPANVLGTVQESVKRELDTTDQVLAAAAAQAIYETCRSESCEQPHFVLEASEVTRVSGEEALSSAVGDAYLVRSKNVATLGDHYIVIIGGLVQKPHGLRPEDISYPAEGDETALLDTYGPDETLVLLKLNDAARLRFYEAHRVLPSHRRS